MIRAQISKLEQKAEKLLELRLEDLITKDEFSVKKTELDKEIADLRDSLADNKKDDSADSNVDTVFANIEKALETYIDFSQIKVADEIVEQFIKQVTVYANGRFKFLIDFSNSKNEDEGKNEVFLYERSVSFEEAYNYRKQFGFYIRKSQWNDIKLEVWTLV